eukprot:GILJ01006488.1.p1 GENE.GILJ01006488.1~~GILJ01006488.1.p1  ORF type:complete len:770 (-),score=153.93 GILJ01006488.1:183-2492(-)
MSRANTFINGPIQFVAVNDQGFCHANPQALEILASIEGRIACVGVAGLYRTGKSFLLNRLLGLQDGFDVGPTVQPCTKGIWMWGTPVQLAPDLFVIFIDTEGLGSFQRNQTVDMKIFSLAILMSSYFVYNSMGAIDEQALENLSLVVNLSKHIHIQSRPVGSDDDGTEFHQYFPTFLWVVRDFSLQLSGRDGVEISAREYLENALRPVEGFNDSVHQKNQIRMMISQFFKERDCMTLVRPVADERELRAVNQMPYESLRPAFKQQVEMFVEKVYANVKPKAIHGTALTGSMFSALAREYCEAINSEGVPTISTAWDRVVDQEYRKALRSGLQVYRDRMFQFAMQRLPLNEEELTSIHKSTKGEARKEFDSKVLQSGDEKGQQFKTELLTKISQIHTHVVGENYTASRAFCDQLIRELHAKIEDQFAQEKYRTYEEFLADWEAMRRTYLEGARGPAQYEVGMEFMARKMGEDVDRLTKQMKINHAREKAELEKGIAEANGRAQAAREMLLQERATFSQQLAEERRRFNDGKLELERACDEARRAYEDVNSRFGAVSAEMEDKLRTMDEDLRETRQRLRDAETEKRVLSQVGGGGGKGSAVKSGQIESLKDAVYAAIAELKQTDADKKHIALKNEHEKQLMGLERKFQKQLQEARRANELTLENLKKTFTEEIDLLKHERTTLELKIKELEKEAAQKSAERDFLRERIVAAENEKKIKVEHAELLCKVSDLILKFLRKLDGWPGFENLNREIDTLSSTTSAITNGTGGRRK